YSKGIHPALQMHIIQQLSLMHPNQQPGEPFDYELVQAAAKYILEIRSQVKDSAGLRALTPTVDGIQEVESILDEGCQVVAMSYDVWQKLGLPLDPTIKISLQSANNESDWSEGICHNVPFDFGGLEVLLQVHVVKNAAYDILLGRPFSILTESKIDNRFNGDQLVTLTDPNTGKTVTLPT
ncbi:hypothetical protein ARMGADRAFT_861228, partial [Armillaria gallica]